MEALISILAIAATLLGAIFTFVYRKQSENRLRIETFLNAIELMTSGDLSEKEKNYRLEGILTALIEIGNLQLVQSLSESFYLDDRINVRFFVKIIDYCLVDERTRSAAISSLNRLSYKIATDCDDKIIYPDSVFVDWLYDSESTAKERAINNLNPIKRHLFSNKNIIRSRDVTDDEKHHLRESLIKILMSKNKSEWKNHVINQVINTLYKIFETEPDESQKISACLQALPLLNYAQKKSDGYVGPKKRSMKFQDMEKKIIAKYPDIEHLNWLTKQSAMLQSTYDLYLEIYEWVRNDSKHAFSLPLKS